MKYGFNERNQVSYAFETINGNKRSIGIMYDKDSRVTSYRKGGVTEAYTYDKYGRLTNKASGTGLRIRNTIMAAMGDRENGCSLGS